MFASVEKKEIINASILLIALLVGALAIISRMTRPRVGFSEAVAGVRELEGHTPEPFQAQYLDQNRFRVGGRVQKPVLLYYFRTDCAACEINRPLWSALTDSLAGSVLAIALTPEKAAKARSYYPDGSGSFRVATFASKRDLRTFVDGYRIAIIPAAYLLDVDGQVRLAYAGLFTDEIAASFIEAIRPG